ncbi:haloacid dehalogenase [Tersicoccus solisilvae]|uniref:Beta-phosphoglucomutase n=1 Tax=Tersicoccus solisilvae TaxID=1882339 RepID=A0ABQ1NJP0_9MICC|nr:beta-phosphoglucomutase family hydrolase [Tersicoccus solisilvae]GGC78838.1 haloacid dehalogenase [Tersicoccus solisilvae]
MDWSDFDAVLFDLDGVLTPTAQIHRTAWAEMFDAFLAGRDQPPFTDADYFAHVDGRPRADGVRAFLASRGIELPEGGPDDPEDAETVHGLGNRKNAAFNAVLARDGIAPYPGSRRLLDALRERGTALAVVSSSRNARPVLEAAGIRADIDCVVDGLTAADEDLAGKPAPDTFLRAAHLLGVDPARAVVVEDATSGVAAGRAGRFGLVLGVDRGAGADTLTDAGADVVVTDLDEVLP